MESTYQTMDTIPPSSTTESIAWYEKVHFTWYDYVLFCGMLLASVLIGIYFGCFGNKQSTAKQYLMGDKKMKVFPIAMSLIASHVSGISLLGVPAEVYKFGSIYALCFISISIASLLTVYLFLPVFYELKVTSIYEYIKIRFNEKVRLFGSFLFALSVLLHLPIVIYIPALAFSQASGLSIHLITPFVCGICIFYTTIGGLKAVVWTDTLQFTITVGAMFTVFYLGIKSAGGIFEVFDKAFEGERLAIDFDWHPTNRDTFWAMAIGFTANYIPHLSLHQGCVQKFLSLPTLRDANISIFIFAVGIIIVKWTNVITGLIMYAKYYDCDPLSTKRVKASDQLLPYYVMDVVGDIPGLAGLFIAGVFCTALSALSAGLNCLSGSIYQDFVARHMDKNISEKSVSNILKLIVVICGIISTAMVLVVERLGGLLALAISLTSIACGPTLGLFTVGMLFPRVNSKGALCGSVAALLFLSWIVSGAQYYKASGLLHYTPKPVSTEGCEFYFVPNNTTRITNDEDVFFLYRISHYYYTFIGLLVCLFVSIPVSWLTRKDDIPVSRKLISPWVHFLLDPEEEKSDYHTIEKANNILINNLINKKV